MFKHLLILFTLITVAASYGQGFNKRFNMNLPSALGSAIVEKDNKYYTVSLVSDSIPNFRACISFNSFNDTGKLLLSKIFRVTGAYSVEPRNNLIQTKDNGFANAGYIFRDTINKDEALLTKYDSTGEVIWYKTFGSGVANSQFFVFQDLIQTDDGGFLAVGSVQRNTFRCSIVVLKTDSLGNEQWRKFYNHQYWSLTGTGIYKSDSGYIVTGLDDNYPLGTFQDKVYSYMMEIDTAGNVLWKWFYTANNKTAVTYTGIRTDDGGYILSGYKIIGQLAGGSDRLTRGYVMKVDVNRNVVWQKIIGYEEDGYAICHFNKAVKNAHNSFTFCGLQATRVSVSPDRGGWFGYLAALSENGDSLWDRYYYITQDSFANTNEFNGLVKNSDGGYTMVGEANEMMANSAGQQLWLVRVDSNGCVQENYCSGSKPVGVAPLSFGEGSGVRFYPNPAMSTITIEIDNKMADTYLMYDLAGRVVLSGAISTNTQTVDISSISSGLYLLQIIRQGSVVGNGRVVKE